MSDDATSSTSSTGSPGSSGSSGSSESFGSTDPATDPVHSAEQQAQRMAARALRRAQSSGGKATRSSRTPARRRSSNSRDPQEVGAVLDGFLAEQGWESTSVIASLTSSWPQIVGADVAEHVQVEAIEDGELRLRADSTAWATQMRLLTGTLLDQIRQAVGGDAVSSVSVRGPSAPSWRAGPRVVKGRGPRDTYG